MSTRHDVLTFYIYDIYSFVLVYFDYLIDSYVDLCIDLYHISYMIFDTYTMYNAHWTSDFGLRPLIEKQ